MSPFKQGNRMGKYANAQRIPAAPFVAWLHQRLEEISTELGCDNQREARARHLSAHAALAGQLGTVERILYRYLRSFDGNDRPTDTFVRETIEKMLHHAGVDLEDIYPLEVLYPDIDPDPPLEPDAWCPTCRETTTPIRGICPWCETQAVAA